MNQFSDDSMDLDTPTSFGTRSLGRRHTSLPTHLVGNASRLRGSGFVMGEDTSPLTDRSSGSITVTSTPPSGPRLAPSSAFLTRRPVQGQARERGDTLLEDL
ncbi:hypothetical protein TWF281_003372 [Arthrobotrys megalospora]